jgi:hypothetical protein
MPKAKEKTETISFRTSGRYLTKLENRAAQDGISIHKEAQKVLEATLDGREDELQLMRVELAEVREQLESVRQEGELLREGIKPALIGIVHGISKLTGENLTLEDAHQFIENAFRQMERGAADVIN